MASSSHLTSDVNEPEVLFHESRTSVGTHRLFYRRAGKGTPAVIFETGCGTPSEDWLEVQSRIAAFTLTLAYDRAGCGRSEAGPAPRTPGTIAAELHALLQALRIPAPYVLVGQSLGGISMRLFAHLYRNETAGLVLVDSAHEEMSRRLPADYWAHEQKNVEGMTGTGRDEAIALEQGYGELTSAGHSLGDLPLTVITAGRKFFDAPRGIRRTPIRAAWSELQRDLVSRSSDGRQVIARDAGHSVHRDDPELVVREIRLMLERC